MKIAVEIRITESESYTTKDIASAKLEIEAPWDDIKPTAIHRALDSVLEDVTDRVNKQLSAIHKAKIEIERSAARDAEESFA